MPAQIYALHYGTNFTQVRLTSHRYIHCDHFVIVKKNWGELTRIISCDSSLVRLIEL